MAEEFLARAIASRVTKAVFQPRNSYFANLSRFYTEVEPEQNRGSVPIVPFEAILLDRDMKFCRTPDGLQTKDQACDPCFQSQFFSRCFLGFTAYVC